MTITAIAGMRSRARRRERRAGPVSPWFPGLEAGIRNAFSDMRSRVASRAKSAPGFAQMGNMYLDMKDAAFPDRAPKVIPSYPLLEDHEHPFEPKPIHVDGTKNPRSTKERLNHSGLVDGTTAITKTLGLELHEVNVLERIFTKLDKDKNGRADIMEFLVYLDVERKPFTAKVFSIFDSDGSGGVDFREFVVSLFQFCSLSNHGLLVLCFKIFAERYDATTYLMKKADTERLLDVIYGTDAASGTRRQQTLRERTADQLSSLSICGALELQGWTTWIERNQHAAAPLVVVQRALRLKCGGEKFWNRIAERRAEDFGDATWLDIEDIVRERHNFAPSSAPVVVYKPKRVPGTLPSIKKSPTGAEHRKRRRAPNTQSLDSRPASPDHKKLAQVVPDRPRSATHLKTPPKASQATRRPKSADHAFRAPAINDRFRSKNLGALSPLGAGPKKDVPVQGSTWQGPATG